MDTKLLAVLGLFTFGATISAQHAENTLFEYKGTVLDEMGSSFSPAGDIDGDGYGDFIVGSPGHDEGLPGRVGVYSGLKGTAIFDFSETSLTTKFGSRVASAGDMNGDGRDDFVVTSAGLVRAYSGHDMATLYQLLVPSHTYGIPAAEGVGDVTGDGYGDLVVGLPQLEIKVDIDIVTVLTNGPGVAMLISGFDGSTVETWTGDFEGDGFGGVVSAVGDVDGDGVGDMAVGCWHDGFPAFGEYTRVFGADGTELLEVMDLATLGSGVLVEELGDVGLDGFADIMISTPAYHEVHFVDGQSGAILRTASAAAFLDHYGRSLAALGDIDVDGSPDALIGAPQPPLMTFFGDEIPWGPGYVELLSGSDMSSLGRFDGFKQNDHFGWSVAGLGDVNDDGVTDIGVGAPRSNLGGGSSGRAYVFSSEELMLYGDLHEISLSAGGEQTLQLDAGSGAAGWPALVLGSITGIDPGLHPGAVKIPLVFDVYTTYLLANPINPLLQGGLTSFDADGQATAIFTIAPGTNPGWAGTTVFHAFMTADVPSLAAGTLQVSQAVPVTLVP